MSTGCISVTVAANVFPAHGGDVAPEARERGPQCSDTCHASASTQLPHYVPRATANHSVKPRSKEGQGRTPPHNRGMRTWPSIGVRRPTV